VLLASGRLSGSQDTTATERTPDDAQIRRFKGVHVRATGPGLAALEDLRKTIRQASPDAQEVIHYNMPASKLAAILVWYAAFETQINFYPRASAIAAFDKGLAVYETSKGAVRFPTSKSRAKGSGQEDGFVPDQRKCGTGPQEKLQGLGRDRDTPATHPLKIISTTGPSEVCTMPSASNPARV
jgi:uncharacterized protein YdhG (YjbR/CyaY superfamily)